MTRLKRIACLIAVTLATAQLAAAADWPVYRHDNQRTGVTADKVDAAKLGLLWVWRSPHRPLKAWAGASAYDAYHGARLSDQRNYDPVFYTVAAGGCVYFGSTVDDSVRCIDAATGKEKWRFTTDAPVRIAPAVVDGPSTGSGQAKVYFGSDDGFVYCLDATKGTLVWKYSPKPAQRRILNNGRAIAMQPCRTGVTIDKGIAYCALSMLPWEQTFFCALDAETGKPVGPGRYMRTYQNLSLEAPTAITADTLFSPQGRTGTMRFRRSDGKDVGGAGPGSFIAINGSEVMTGPGTRGQSIGGIGGAFDLVADGGVKYAVGSHNVVCLAGRKDVRWNVALPGSRGIIKAGDILFSGGKNRVAAFSATDGKELWFAAVEGTAHGLAVADGRLIASTDEGHVYCFGPGGKAVAKRIPAEPGKPMGAADPAPISLPTCPHVTFTAPDTARVYWETAEPSPTIIEYGHDTSYRKIEKTAKTTTHWAELTGLVSRGGYTYIIRATVGGTLRSTRPGMIDMFFNYALPAVNAKAKPFDDDRTRKCAATAEKILQATELDRGLCVVLDCGEGQLAWEIAKRTRMRVIGFDTDPEAIARGRDALMATGDYGQRVSLHLAPRPHDVPLVSESANLVISQALVSGGDSRYTNTEAHRLVKPRGYAVLDPAKAPFRKPVPEWAGVWSHQYGWGANASYGGEELAGASHSSQLGVQWVGRPGPRYQPDREPRKPAPLAAGGRLYAQGLRRIVTMDAHNGTILWSLEIPGLIRMNMPDDCGNWCADEDFVYAVVADKCWKIDGPTGKVIERFGVSGGQGRHWGYVAREGSMLIGSTIRPGSTFTNYKGRGGWYDDASSGKVTSSGLFGLDPQSGKAVWTYRKGTIINSTITTTPQYVYFLEGRGNLWAQQHLVALDTVTGKVAWEEPFTPPGGSIVYFLMHSGDKLLLGANHRGRYNVYGFSDKNGKQLWHSTTSGGGDHGAHMTHPAVVDGKAFVRPQVFDMKTGKGLGAMPTGGCGTYATSRYGVFFRALHSTMWSFDKQEGSNFHRLRPDCWLSTVPGCGMLLSPEASGGCWCGSWMETSVGFKPKTDLPVFKTVDLQFTGELDVAIRPPLLGGTVHYTTDGSEPTPQSPKADTPIHIEKTTVITACIVRGGKAGKSVARTFARIESKVATELQVNFQTPGGSPEGWVGDFGEPFAVRPNGYAYGWSQPMKDAVRDRRRQGPLLGTQIFFMPGITWSCAVENGTYEVSVSVGDAAYRMPDGTVYVNGVTLCKGIRLGQEGHQTFTKEVKVTDGRITMYSHQKAAPADRTRINWITFKKK